MEVLQENKKHCSTTLFAKQTKVPHGMAITKKNLETPFLLLKRIKIKSVVKGLSAACFEQM